MSTICPVSVLIPTRNEQRNLDRCLAAIAHWADEIVIVDSYSTDATLAIASRYGATVLQFTYGGGWPKKRQWALDTFNWRNDWVLLLDADEILLPEIKAEIAEAIKDPLCNGYWLKFQIFFLGKMLRHGGTSLWKLSLFRKGKGRYEMRLRDQDQSMCDMEVHEHVVVEGVTRRLNHPVRHENLKSLDDYISKHNSYSNWDAKLNCNGGQGELKPSLFGNQAERRRYLKDKLIRLPGSPLAYFALQYVINLGFLDGRPGFIHSMFKAIQLFHIKAKVYEMELASEPRPREIDSNTFENMAHTRLVPGACHNSIDDAKHAPERSDISSAVDWHSAIAHRFDLKYRTKERFVRRYQIWTEAIEKHSKANGHVLDVGCGTGIFTFYAANLNRSAVGLDGSQKMIDICESKRRELNTSNVEFVQTDVAHIGQVPMERPDLILCSSVLEYLDNLDQMLLSLSSLLMRKGFLLISMPNKTSVYRSMEAAFFKMTGRPRYYRYVRNVLTQEQMRHKLQACGLDILRTEYYADAPLLSRALRGIGFPQYADLMYIMVAQKP